MGQHDALRERMIAEGLDPGAWSNGAGDRYARHDHIYDKVIVVASGSIAFGVVDDGRTIELEAGDRLELPARTVHDAVVGPSGVACLEAHRPAGSLAGLARRPAGSW
jgi:mannose-6-phosphate isomerase-like protein (cupin superfamily)